MTNTITYKKEENLINVSDAPEREINPNENKRFFLNGGVKESKDYALKTRLQTLIRAAGMSEPDFYNQLRLSRQLWYYYSWGVWECPVEVKVRISKALNTDSSAIWQNTKSDFKHLSCSGVRPESSSENKFQEDLKK